MDAKAMPAAVPATIASEIGKKLGKLVFNSSEFRAADEFQIRRLSMDIDKLMKVDAADGHLLKSGVSQLIGNVDAMRYEIKCAEALSSSPAVQRVMTCNLINLGFFSEAQQAFRAAIDPRRGEFSVGLEIGFACGAFSTMAMTIEQAMRMNIEVPAEVQSRLGRIMLVLTKANITDETIGGMLDVAGAVMRQNRLFFHGLEPEIMAVDDDDLGQCVYMTYMLAVSPERAAELQYDLTCRLVDQIDDLPAAFSVGLQSVSFQ
jgi:hypothetical protein